MKECIKCKIKKDLKFFYFRKDTEKYRSLCKSCTIIQSKFWNKVNSHEIKVKKIKIRNQQPWKSTLEYIKTRCNNKKSTNYNCYGGKGVKCLITANELKELWFRDKAYLMKKPSIDREDNNGHYEYFNCRYIEKSANIAKMNIESKSIAIIQYDLNNKLLKHWSSLRLASKELNIDASSICKCCKHRVKTAGGFKWHYKT